RRSVQQIDVALHLRTQALADAERVQCIGCGADLGQRLSYPVAGLGQVRAGQRAEVHGASAGGRSLSFGWGKQDQHGRPVYGASANRRSYGWTLPYCEGPAV